MNHHTAMPLVTSCEGLVRHGALRYARIAPHLLDDLIAEARLAVLLAADKYDPTRGAFPAFAYLKIDTACYCVVQQQRWAVTLPIYRGAKRAPAISAASLVRVGDDGEERELLIAAEERCARDVLAIEALSAAFQRLAPRERAVLEGRFAEDATLPELGERLGLSGERVRQLETRALAKLREAVTK